MVAQLDFLPGGPESIDPFDELDLVYEANLGAPRIMRAFRRVVRKWANVYQQRPLADFRAAVTRLRAARRFLLEHNKAAYRMWSQWRYINYGSVYFGSARALQAAADEEEQARVNEQALYEPPDQNEKYKGVENDTIDQQPQTLPSERGLEDLIAAIDYVERGSPTEISQSPSGFETLLCAIEQVQREDEEQISPSSVHHSPVQEDQEQSFEALLDAVNHVQQESSFPSPGPESDENVPPSDESHFSDLTDSDESCEFAPPSGQFESMGTMSMDPRLRGSVTLGGWESGTDGATHAVIGVFNEYDEFERRVLTVSYPAGLPILKLPSSLVITHEEVKYNRTYRNFNAAGVEKVARRFLYLDYKRHRCTGDSEAMQGIGYQFDIYEDPK